MTDVQAITAHSGGVCDLAFEPSGQHLMSCGSDTIVRIYNVPNGNGDLTALQSRDFDHDTLAVAFTTVNGSSRVAALSRDKQLQLLEFPSLDLDRVLTRFTLEGGHVASCSAADNHAWIAACADDGSVRLVDAQDPSSIKTLTGCENHSVRSVAVDARHVAAACVDGHVLVWNHQSTVPIHKARVLPLSLSGASAASIVGGAQSVAFRCAFEPTKGDLLAVPGELGCQLLRVSHEFSVLRTLTAPSAGASPQTPTLAVAWSPNGAYVACATMSRRVHVFHTAPTLNALYGSQSAAGAASAACSVVATLVCDDQIASMAWSPALNAIAVVDNAGKLYYWRSVVPAEHVSPCQTVDFSVVSSAAASQSKGGRLKKLGQEVAAEDSDDELAGVDDDVAESQAEQEARAAQALAAEQASKAAAEESDRKRKKRHDDDFDPDEITADDMEVINEGKGLAAGNIDGDVGAYDESPESLRASMLKAVRDAMRDEFAPSMQPAFQPGSTPVVETGSRRAQPQRFLAWNDVGALLCREDDSVSHVEIEFADANRRPIRFQQPFSFTLGALGANGALLASIADDDVPPTLWFQPFDSWVTKPEWLVQMDMKEEPRSMAVGGSFAAVATSSRLLRILTFSGLQRAVISLPGPPVALAAQGNWLAAVYHSHHARAGEQNLRMSLYSVRSEVGVGIQLVSDDPVPLSSETGTTLQWIGFSSDGDGQVFTYDSQQRLRVRVSVGGGAWMMVLDLEAAKLAGNKTAINAWWPLAVSDGQLLYCMLHKSEPYPLVSPRPVVLTTSLLMPLLARSTASAYVLGEEEFVLASMRLHASLHAHADDVPEKPTAEELMQGEDNDSIEQRNAWRQARAELDKKLLKLIHHACKPTQQRHVKALEYAFLLHNASSVELAVQLAHQAGATQLSQRLMALAQVKSQQEMTADDAVHQAHARPVAASRPQPALAAPAKSTASKAASDSVDFVDLPDSPRAAVAESQANSSSELKKRKAEEAPPVMLASVGPLAQSLMTPAKLAKIVDPNSSTKKGNPFAKSTPTTATASSAGTPKTNAFK